MGAAVHWARGGKPDTQEPIDALRAFGATPEQLAEAQDYYEALDRDFGVWAENDTALEAFCALGTQWRMLAHMSGVVWTGIEYAAIPPVLRLMAVPRAAWRDTFGALQIMERAALAALNGKH